MDPDLTVLGLVCRDFAPLRGSDPQAAGAATAVEFARIRFRRDHDAALQRSQTMLSVTRISAAQLATMGCTEAATARLLAPPGGGAPGLKTPLLRLDWLSSTVLFNPHNGVLLMPPEREILPPPAPPVVPRPAPPPQRRLVIEQPAVQLPPQEHWSAVEDLSLGAQPWPPELAALLEAAERLHTLTLHSAAQLGATALAHCPFPALRTLVLQGTRDLDQRQRWRDRLHALSGIQRLRIACKADPALFATLAAAPWWQELSHLDLDCIYLRQAEPGWSALWQPPPALRWLRIRYLDRAAALPLLRTGGLPALAHLALVQGEIDGALLGHLGDLQWPRLQQLDLRQQNFQPGALAALLASGAFPALTALAASFSSDRRIDYTDWDGSVVGHGYAPMEPAEVQQACGFAARGLRWLEQFPDWQTR